MRQAKLRKIKISIVILTALLVGIMVVGVSGFKDNYYLNWRFLNMEKEYLKNKIILYRSGDIAKASSSNGQTADSVPILLYHGVMADPNWKPDGVNISLTDFRDQMFALKKAGYETISLSDFLAFMQSGQKLPDRSILITFDDSRSDSFYNADPVLHALDYKAVMFVITGSSFTPDNHGGLFSLSQEELAKMQESGRWELASHTQNGHGFIKIDANGTQGHFLTDKIWLDSEERLETDQEFTKRISADLSASKTDLEKLGVKVLGFAYPFGDYGDDTQNFPGSQNILQDVVNSLFPLSFRQTDQSEFPANYPGKDFRMVKRIDVNSDMSSDQLLFLLNSSQEKTIPYTDSFSGNNGWLTGWGNFELKNGLLLTKASASEDSSMTFLNGTFSWTDYVMSANARLTQGDGFAAMARLSDGNNYASCDFSAGGVALSQSIGGVENVVSESDQDLPIAPAADMVVGIGVSGNKGTCYIGGKIVVSGVLSPNLKHGGVGFKTWGNTINSSSLLVSQVNVAPAQ